MVTLNLVRIFFRVHHFILFWLKFVPSRSKAVIFMADAEWIVVQAIEPPRFVHLVPVPARVRRWISRKIRAAVVTCKGVVIAAS
jgi:hypothetical protein